MDLITYPYYGLTFKGYIRATSVLRLLFVYIKHAEQVLDTVSLLASKHCRGVPLVCLNTRHMDSNWYIAIVTNTFIALSVPVETRTRIWAHSSIVYKEMLPFCIQSCNGPAALGGGGYKIIFRAAEKNNQEIVMIWF